MPGLEELRRVAEQNHAYRRGVVLGLTMAEVSILIIFVLLLLIGFDQWTQSMEHESSKGTKPIKEQRLLELEERERVLAEVAAALNLPIDTTSDQIRSLVRAVLEAARTPQGNSALQDAKAVLKDIRAVRDGLVADGNSEKLTDKVVSQAHALANKEGQLTHLEGRLLAAGLGKGERPCWVKRDGTIEFLYDVVLTSAGIRMKEIDLPQRQAERAPLPMPVTDLKEDLTPGEFLRRTEPLFRSSVAQNCRFFVTVFDGTGPTEKALYKNLLRTVEGHFYKRLSLEPAPF